MYLYYIGSASRNEENGKKHVDLTEILGIAGVPTFLFIHADGEHYFLIDKTTDALPEPRPSLPDYCNAVFASISTCI